MSENLSLEEIRQLITRLNENPTKADIAQAGRELFPNVIGSGIGRAKTACTFNNASTALKLVNNAIDALGVRDVDLQPSTHWFNSAPSTACEIVRSR